MSLTFVNEIPAATRGAASSQWADTVTALKDNPGTPAIVAEYPVEEGVENAQTKAQSKASAAQSQLKKLGIKAVSRTDREANVVRLYGTFEG